MILYLPKKVYAQHSTDKPDTSQLGTLFEEAVVPAVSGLMWRTLEKMRSQTPR